MEKRLKAIILAAALLSAPWSAWAQYYGYYGDRYQPPPTPTAPPSIVFPVEMTTGYTDDFGAPRSGGRTHEGIDILAPKMTRILAAQAGRVVFAPFSEPSYGYMISVRGDDGYTYNYLHINNDTPGTDDGAGGTQYAYAPGIEEGARVTQGQHIAWVGDSGDAEATVPHLHFEIRLPDGTPIDPYPYLQAAQGLYKFDPAAATAASPTIAEDKGIVGSASAACPVGTLVKLANDGDKTTHFDEAVYYCGGDGKRYVFPNSKIYASWYPDFSGVQIIDAASMADLQIGGNVTYRPGVRLVKITTDPKVYAVDLHGTLRWVTTSAIAAKLYGTYWAKKVDDLPDEYFVDYTIGQPINAT